MVFLMVGLVMRHQNSLDSEGAKFIRPPLPGKRCPITGLGRGHFYQLIREGKIRAVQLRQPGASRGVTLVYADSLLSFLESQPHVGAQGVAS